MKKRGLRLGKIMRKCEKEREREREKKDEREHLEQNKENS